MSFHFLRSAFQGFRRQKMYVAITAIGLSLALGASLLILSFVNFELSFEDCHKKADRIYRVGGKWSRDDLILYMATTMYPLGPSLKAVAPQVEQQVRLRRIQNVTVGTEHGSTVREPKFLLADPSVFAVFSIPLIQGDPQSVLTRPSSVVISERVSKDLFAGANPCGQTITIQDSVTLTVTGVMEDMPLNTQLHTNFLASFSTLDKLGEDTTAWTRSSSFPAYTYVLLDEGTDPKTIDEVIPGVLATNAGDDAQNYTLQLQPLEDLYLHSNLSDELGPTGSLSDIYLFAGISFLLVLMACFNYVNLSVSRVYHRHKEVVARSIAGASRSQLFGQFLAESIVLTSLAMAFGLVLYEFSIPYLEQYVGKNLDVDLWSNSFIWLAAPTLVFLVGVLCGSYPAAVLLRLQPKGILSHHLSVGSGKSRLRQCLVICQAFIAIGLVGFTVGMQQQLNFVETYDYGFNPGNVWLFEFDKDVTRDQKERLKHEYQKAGLAQTTLATNAPGESLLRIMTARLNDHDENESQFMSFFTGDADYASTFGLRLTRGHLLSDESVEGMPGAVLINETAANLLDLNDPIGVELTSSTGPITIVGVVEDFLALSLHNQVMPSIITKSAKSGRLLAVRLPEDGQQAAIQRMQDIWTEIVPGIAFRYRPLNDVMSACYSDEQKMISLLTLASGLAIFIACLGLLGLVSFTVERRTKEVGIRKCIGASVMSIVNLFTREFIILMAIAGVIAWPFTHYAVTRWLQGFAYRIDYGLFTFVLVVAAVIILSLSIVGIHVVKTATANPVDALRHD